ncbi:MAG: succinate dehydrogenase assembly factor 2 [Gammaproteobacteria bacterium]|nr:succinate dehydrogenase assembly factor 2 [Gammaproteobacteria bacterium]
MLTINQSDSDREIKRLLWRCRRGTRELDIVLSRFVTKYYADLNRDERVLFESLLEKQDPILNEWLYNDVMPEDQGMATIVKRILLTH